ncbi:TPA: hypothetical protein ACGAD2_002205 [Salmonella enterica subsp. enterica serovar Newport]
MAQEYGIKGTVLNNHAFFHAVVRRHVLTCQGDGSSQVTRVAQVFARAFPSSLRRAGGCGMAAHTAELSALSMLSPCQYTLSSVTRCARASSFLRGRVRIWLHPPRRHPVTSTTERLYASGRQKHHALATVRLASSGSLVGSERRLYSEGNSRDGSRGFLSPRGKRCGGLRRVAPP